MEENENKVKKDYSWLRPVLVFYAKTTAWIVIPLIVGFIAAKYFGESFGGQTLFFLIIMISFGITCFGIYREIKEYKKKIIPTSPKATEGQDNKDNK